MSLFKKEISRRSALKGASAFAGSAIAAPLVFSKGAWAQEFLNDPGDSPTVTLGFNVPQTGAYADEGADELRAYELAVKHINGEGDGGMEIGSWLFNAIGMVKNPFRIIERLRVSIGRRRRQRGQGEPWYQDPMSHPAVQRMTPNQLADLPLSRHRVRPRPQSC